MKTEQTLRLPTGHPVEDGAFEEEDVMGSSSKAVLDWARWVGVALLVCGLAGGCGGGSSGPPPQQNYTVTVSATAGSIQHSTKLTVTVE